MKDAASRSPDITISADIARARTLPGSFYSDPQIFERCRDRVFAPSWQVVGHAEDLKVPGAVRPASLLEGAFDEPLLLTRDRDDRLHCVSNVCTHRGALVCEAGGVESVLRCRYHGRRFRLDGSFLSMPEFDGVEEFPSEADDLPAVGFGEWRKFLFASLEPARSLEELVAEMERRVGWLPIEEAVFDPARSRDYLVRANWALYCDNYLEGFHIPYVHAALADSVDYDTYAVETFDAGVLQIGYAAGAEESMSPPEGHPEHGRRVVAYYFWLFPNLMFNFYTWGVSLNLVKPLAVDRTKVSFLTWSWDPKAPEAYSTDRVEREDEAVVESVQQGVSSRLYDRGRYSPAREPGVHHFHRLLAAALA
ncbi:MAG: aromatic ring-hydroxylating dioxygenase subunit alpha [Thermoanaerobaculia bacterium]|nr:aromatic ring-hydroxylating dioxygenase subunit alpha [Thermoanaerobaculia bacterium]